MTEDLPENLLEDLIEDLLGIKINEEQEKEFSETFRLGFRIDEVLALNYFAKMYPDPKNKKDQKHFIIREPKLRLLNDDGLFHYKILSEQNGGRALYDFAVYSAQELTKNLVHFKGISDSIKQ